MKKTIYSFLMMFTFVSFNSFAQANGIIHFTGSIVNPPCKITSLKYECYNGNNVSEKGNIILSDKTVTLKNNVASYKINNINKYDKVIVISYN